ncbi:MAG: sulfate ABC transporter ATP-binding protein [Verrucomicrobiota bacterium]|nr:sulfate ABC transporter ATP-binding protein [Verrucomicrobiota bacterium]
MSILAQNITKTFGKHRALNDVTVNVPSGKLVALLGPSGSGKTTLLRIIAGLEWTDAGTGGKVLFNDEEVTHLPPAQRKVGFVFQHYALFKHMTVFDNIAFGLNVRKKATRPAKSEITDRVHNLLKLIRLDGLDQRLPNQLSGGQRQRVALARALAVEPKVLLLDEPFGALDAQVRKELRRWLRQFHEEIHITTIFVTHDQEEALELADEVVVMNNAKVEQVGIPQTVFDHPASPFVIEFLGSVNRLAAGMRNPDPSKGRAVYVRPHDVRILPPGSPESAIQARVLHVFSAGRTARVTLERINTKEVFEAEISRSELRQAPLSPGDIVRVYFHHIRVFSEKVSSGQDEFIELPGSELAKMDERGQG